MQYNKWKKAALGALAGGAMLAQSGLATVTGVNITLVTEGASTDAQDTADLSIAFINVILTSFVGKGNIVGVMMVLLLILGLIGAVFGAIVGLLRGIASIATAFK
jgi:hypothetical protein